MNTITLYPIVDRYAEDLVWIGDSARGHELAEAMRTTGENVWVYYGAETRVYNAASMDNEEKRLLAYDLSDMEHGRPSEALGLTEQPAARVIRDITSPLCVWIDAVLPDAGRGATAA